MSSSAFSRLVTVPVTGSTNADLRAVLGGSDGRVDPSAQTDWPHLSALRAQAQTAGRGRADHAWVTPPTGALTVSVVLRPLVPPGALEWLPLLAGLAVQRTLAPHLEGTGWRARTKWPNDVVILPDGDGPEDLPGWGRARKVAGILCELLPASGGGTSTPDSRAVAPAVIVGIGINLGQRPDELPVPWAASLAGAGARRADAQDVLEDLGGHLARVVSRWEEMGGDPDGADGDLGRALREACSSLGRRLIASTPSGPVRGTAIDLRPGLVLRTDAEGREAEEGGSPHEVVIAAGDVALARETPPGAAPGATG